MANYVGSLVSVDCPFCGFKMPIPAYMGEYNWKTGGAYQSEHEWYCVNCGEKHTVKVKRHVDSAEVVRTTREECDD